MNNKITATIITRNEETNIERCLKSLDWVDEIVIIDSFSEDRTVEICEKYKCKIVQTEWKGFGKTKKYAVDIASNDWIFSIDADEEVTTDLKNKILSLLENPQSEGYKIKRTSYYLGNKIKYCGWDRDFPLRLFNKRSGNFNEKDVHESVLINGKKEKVNEALLHFTYPTISSHISKMNRYTDLSLNQMNKKYSLIASLFFGFNKFLKMYFLQKGFLDGKVGFLLSINSAYGIFLKYIKTWQKTD